MSDEELLKELGDIFRGNWMQPTDENIFKGLRDKFEDYGFLDRTGMLAANTLYRKYA